MAGPVLGEESDQRILLEQRSVPVRYGGSVCGHATHLRSQDQLPFLKLIGGSWVGLSRLAWDLPSSAGMTPVVHCKDSAGASAFSDAPAVSLYVPHLLEQTGIMGVTAGERAGVNEQRTRGR